MRFKLCVYLWFLIGGFEQDFSRNLLNLVSDVDSCLKSKINRCCLLVWFLLFLHRFRSFIFFFLLLLSQSLWSVLEFAFNNGGFAPWIAEITDRWWWYFDELLRTVTNLIESDVDFWFWKSRVCDCSWWICFLILTEWREKEFSVCWCGV